MSLNVNQSVADAFYRYKMPKLQVKVEGRGNGIRTVIANMVQVAKSLSRPPSYPLKYFGSRLGAQTQIDSNRNSKDERFIVNGSHEASNLQDLLDGFIRKFVLCPKCENPETVLSVSGNKKKSSGSVSQTCRACGFSGLLQGGDQRLTTYIIKNPPNDVETNGKYSRNGSNTEGRSIVVNNNNKNPDEDEDEEWLEADSSEEAVQKRQAELSAGVKSLTLTSDAEKPERARMDLFHNFLSEAKRSSTTLDDKKILAEAERLDVRAKAALILAELLFDQDILLQIPAHRRVLLRFCHRSPRTQKYLLGGIEQVIGIHREELLPKAGLVLEALYDGDILEEQVLLEWHSNQGRSKNYVTKELRTEIHAKALPFIMWLREAEIEESSSEGESDGEDEFEIVYDDRAGIISSMESQTPGTAGTFVTLNTENVIVQQDIDNGDDLDIDEI